METIGPTNTPDSESKRSLLDLPPEILFVILGNLDTLDIMALRQTCSSFLKLTHERSIWMNILQEKIHTLPLPRDLYLSYFEDKYLPQWPSHILEDALTEAALSWKTWKEYRVDPYKIPRERIGSTLLGLQLFADRWLLAYYFEGAVHLYDTQTQQPPGDAGGASAHYQAGFPALRATLFLENSSWITYEASLNAKGDKLILASSRSMPPHRIHIYEVNLPLLANTETIVAGAFQLVKQIIIPVYKTVKALDASQCLVATSSPGFLEIFKWDERLDSLHQKGEPYSSYQLDNEDLEGLWNGVVAVHFIDEYILVCRVRSIEAFPYKQTRIADPDGKPDPVGRHAFPSGYRDVRFSDNIIRVDPLFGTKIMETTVLAYDIIQGLFRYTVKLTADPTNTDLPPSLEVTLTDVYPLAPGLGDDGLYIPLPSTHEAVPLPQSTTFSANFTPIHSPQRNAHTDTASPTTVSTPTHDRHIASRGFISALAAGPQGKRAIWIARKRTTTSREVLVWSQDPQMSQEREAHRRVDGSHPAFEIPKTVVYRLDSYDLRDDITCCTFSEFTGTIFLGLRSGEITVLQPRYQSPVVSSSEVSHTNWLN